MSAPDSPPDAWASQPHTQGRQIGYDMQDTHIGFSQPQFYRQANFTGIEAIYVAEGVGIDPTAGWADMPGPYTSYSTLLTQGPSYDTYTEATPSGSTMQPCADNNWSFVTNNGVESVRANPGAMSQNTFPWNDILQKCSLSTLRNLLEDIEGTLHLRKRVKPRGIGSPLQAAPRRLPGTTPYPQIAPTVTKACPFDTACALVFTSPNKEALKQHHREQHGGLQTTICHWSCGTRPCGKALKDFDGLMKHIAQVHLKEKACKCAVCGEVFSRRDSRNRHQRRCDKAQGSS